MTTQSLTTKVYEQDYYLWLEITLKNLQERKLDCLDWEHLVEEIETFGNEQKRKLESYVRQLIIHLLLYKYCKQERDYCSNGWKSEIENFRDELEFLLRSKTLYNYFLQQFENVYKKARRTAITKTGLSGDIFPVDCPFSPQETLDPEYLPDF